MTPLHDRADPVPARAGWGAPTLARRLTVAFGALPVLGTALLLAVVIPGTSRQAEADRRDVLTQLAVTAARSIDRTLVDRYRDVQLTRAVPDMAGSDRAAQRAFLNRVQRSQPELAWLGLADAAGTVRAASGGLLEGENVSARPWFREGRRAPAVGDVHDAVMLAALLPPDGRGPRRFVDISVPVVGADGAVRGVLGAHLSFSWVEGVERTVVGGRAGRNLTLVVLDRAGTVLHGPAALRGRALEGRPVLTGGQGSVSGVQGGERTLSGYARTDAVLPGLGWTVLVQQPAAEALAAVSSLQRRIVGWGVVIVALSTLLAAVTARAATRPLRDLTDATGVLRSDPQHGTLPVLNDYAEVQRLSTTLRDLLAQRRAAEAGQAQLTASLEERVAARTAQLSEANEALDAFTSSVSHDLRAPLRHLRSYPVLLRAALTRGQMDRAGQHLDAIERSAARMDEMTDALLEFARTSQRDLHLRSVDLGAVLAAVVDAQQHDVGVRDVRWEIGPLPTVDGDARLLRQVLENLVANAVKYTRGRTPAVIRVWAEEGPDEWTVYVQDNGAGFDPQYAARLFGVFQRLHRADEFEGTGVGLASVRRIVARHGGQVSALGRPGEGATFGFTLPRTPGGSGRGPDAQGLG